MGLDIYVRWGELVKVSEGYVRLAGWYEQNGTWRNYFENQMTGMESAPESGYLRESWGRLEWVREMAKKHAAPNPYSFFADWGGSNGEELLVDGETMERLLKFRDDVLIPWLAKRQELFDVLDGDARKEFRIFCQGVRNVIGLINFVQVHVDKPNLVIIFG